MSRLEKMKKLDQELKETLEECDKLGMSRDEIRNVAKPVLIFHEKWKRKEHLYTIIYMSVAVAIVAALYQSRATSEFISAVAKIGMVKVVLPYWDWTGLHQKECIFENPYRVQEGVTEDDCEPFTGLTSIPRESAISQDEMAEDFLFTSVPIIIADSMADWKAIKELDFNIDFVTKLYMEDPVLSNTSVCGFSGDEDTLAGFLSSISSKDNFQEHWGHCRLPAAKVIRKFYQRPYFLPGMVEADPKNYLAVGRRKDPEKPREFTQLRTYDMQMTWFSQVKGQFLFQLIPHELCRLSTSVIEDILHEGETLVFNREMWQFQYSAYRDGDAVAISSGGSWND